MFDTRRIQIRLTAKNHNPSKLNSEVAALKSAISELRPRDDNDADTYTLSRIRAQRHPTPRYIARARRRERAETAININCRRRIRAAAAAADDDIVSRRQRCRRRADATTPGFLSLSSDAVCTRLWRGGMTLSSLSLDCYIPRGVKWNGCWCLGCADFVAPAAAAAWNSFYVSSGFLRSAAAGVKQLQT